MIVSLGYSTFRIRPYWFIPVVLVVACEILLVRHYPLTAAIVGTYEVSGVFHRSGSSKNYTATIDGKEVYFDPSPFGAGVSVEAKLIPNDTNISAQVVDLKTMVGTVPFLVRAESKGTVFLEYSSRDLRSSWYSGAAFYSVLGAMIVFGFCLIPALAVVPQRLPQKTPA